MNYSMTTLACLAILSAFTSACSNLRVKSDFDPQADFSGYKTYSWLPEDHPSAAADSSGVPSDLVEQRIRTSIERQLLTKNLRPAMAGTTPDLYVTDHQIQRERIDTTGSGSGMGLGYGFGSWGGGASSSIYDVRSATEGTLVIDLVDTRSSRLVWRGMATDPVPAPEQSAGRIDQAVAETFKKYPPSA
jgi:hypothetical protein